MKFFGLKALKAFVLAGIVSGLVVSCDSGVVGEGSALPNEQNVVAKQSSAKQFTPAQIAEMSVANGQLESMSIAIAKTLTDESMRQWVYGECIERFDGETNVLWQHLNRDRSRAWANKISAAMPQNKEIFNVEAAIARIQSNKSANLHLFWYNADKWDKKSSPIVVYTPVDKDPEKMPYLTGFDAQGRSYQVDEAFAKTHTVVVLTFNERTNLEGNIVFSQTNRQVPSKNGAKLNAPGDDFLYIRVVTFNSASESWFAGDPEMYAEVSNGTYVQRFNLSVTLADCNNFTPKRVDISVFAWILPNRSNTTSVQWKEADDFLEGADDVLQMHTLYYPSTANGSQYSSTLFNLGYDQSQVDYMRVFGNIAQGVSNPSGAYQW